MPLDGYEISIRFGEEMKVHKRMHNGVERWIVDGRVNGKRQRPQFDSKKQAEAYMKSIEKEPVVSAWWSDLTPAERVDLHAAYNIAKEEGFSLVAAAHT